MCVSCIYVCIYDVYMYICIYVRVYIYIYIYMSTYVCTYVCMYVYMYGRMYKYPNFIILIFNYYHHVYSSCQGYFEFLRKVAYWVDKIIYFNYNTIHNMYLTVSTNVQGNFIYKKKDVIEKTRIIVTDSDIVILFLWNIHRIFQAKYFK